MKCWASIENRNWYHNYVFFSLSLYLFASHAAVSFACHLAHGMEFHMNWIWRRLKLNKTMPLITQLACWSFFSAILWSINFVDNETVLCLFFLYSMWSFSRFLEHMWSIVMQYTQHTMTIEQNEKKKFVELSVQSQCQCYSIPLNLLLAESLKISNDLILVRAICTATAELNENIIELSNHYVIGIWNAFDWCLNFFLFAACLFLMSIEFYDS